MAFHIRREIWVLESRSIWIVIRSILTSNINTPSFYLLIAMSKANSIGSLTNPQALSFCVSSISWCIGVIWCHYFPALTVNVSFFFFFRQIRTIMDNLFFSCLFKHFFKKTTTLLEIKFKMLCLTFALINITWSIRTVQLKSFHLNILLSHNYNNMQLLKNHTVIQ